MALQRLYDMYVVAQADLEDEDHKVNIPLQQNGGIGKRLGLMVLMGTGVDDTTHILVYAEGSGKNSKWSQPDGVVKYTPV